MGQMTFLKENQAQNKPYLKSLNQISEDEQRKIIQTEFQLQAEGKISFKNYY